MCTRGGLGWVRDASRFCVLIFAIYIHHILCRFTLLFPGLASFQQAIPIIAFSAHEFGFQFTSTSMAAIRTGTLN
ncbi:hypothetical protein BJV78DRAFT_1230247 [Lactifluus subvellereus]|nr:hypothetical protein BJV78DRAFT_1230247 [Lactifluus subvellereus]